MGLLDRFRKEPDLPELDPLKDLVIAKLQEGWLLDYDLRTWRVTDHNLYRFNDGRRAAEWELSEGHDKLYLELDPKSGTVSLSREIAVNAIDGDVRRHILDHEDPPERLAHDGVEYFLDGSVGGSISSAKATGPNRDLIVWEFLDEAEERFLSIVQWSDTEFTAAVGEVVQDYLFSNILPGSPE